VKRNVVHGKPEAATNRSASSLERMFERNAVRPDDRNGDGPGAGRFREGSSFIL
jgi:hypothetical protein